VQRLARVGAVWDIGKGIEIEQGGYLHILAGILKRE